MVAEVQLVALADLDRAAAVHHLDAADELADVAGAVAGVGPQGAADGAGNADQRFQAGQAVPRRLRDQRRHRRPGAGPDALALDGDLREGRLAQAQHDAAHALVAHQHVAAAAEDAQGHALFETAAHEGGQLLARARLHEHLGRAAQLQVGVRRQRLVALDDLGKVVEAGHGGSSSSLEKSVHHMPMMAKTSTCDDSGLCRGRPVCVKGSDSCRRLRLQHSEDAMADFTPHQQKIIKRYYDNQDQIQSQRLAELVTDLYLAEGKKRQHVWKSIVAALQKLKVPQ